MVSVILRNIRYQHDTGCYLATEGGYSYKFGSELMNNLKKHLQENPVSLIAEWYRHLPDTDRVQVQRVIAYS